MIHIQLSIGEVLDKLSSINTPINDILNNKYLISYIDDVLIFYYHILSNVNSSLDKLHKNLKNVSNSNVSNLFGTEIYYLLNCKNNIINKINFYFYNLLNQNNILQSSPKNDQIYDILKINYEYKFKNEHNAYCLTHFGLGDNITMIGAMRYLSTIYNKIYIIIKFHNLKNMVEFYKDDPSIKFLTFTNDDELKDIINSINTDIDDILISGDHNQHYSKTKINNMILKNRQFNNNKFKKHEWSDLHISFYNYIKLSFSYYYDYFYIRETQNSIDLWNSIKHFNVILTHEMYSTRGGNPPDQEIDLSNYIYDYLLNDDYIVISCNINYYRDFENINENSSHVDILKNKKFHLAKHFISILLINYITTIKNAEKIFMVDSSISCFLFPLVEKGELKANEIKVIERSNSFTYNMK